MNILSKINLVLFTINVPFILSAQTFNSVSFTQKAKILGACSPSNCPKDLLAKQATSVLSADVPAYNLGFLSTQEVAMPLEDIALTSKFGYRFHPILKERKFHGGIDLAAHRSVVFAVLKGYVQAAGFSTTLGNFVCLNHGQVTTTYGHLAYIAVKPGQLISAGESIGISGHTGRATGEHLHFMVKYQGEYLDPWAFLQLLARCPLPTSRPDDTALSLSVSPLIHFKELQLQRLPLQ